MTRDRFDSKFVTPTLELHILGHTFYSAGLLDHSVGSGVPTGVHVKLKGFKEQTS